MSDTQSHTTSPTFAGTANGAPLARGFNDLPAVRWARAKLFNNWVNSAFTLVFAYLIIKGFIAVISWGVINAVWTVPGTNTQECRAMSGVGACWALINEKFRFIMFGTYPYAGAIATRSAIPISTRWRSGWVPTASTARASRKCRRISSASARVRQ